MKYNQQEAGTTTAKKQAGKERKAASTPKPEAPISKKRISKRSSMISMTESPEANQDALSPSISNREKIALLAYSYWEQRGCQGGSAEEDWYRAERVLSSKQSL